MTDPPISPHPLSYAPPDRRQSRAGIISFICGLISVLSICLSLVQVKGTSSSSPPITRFIGILIFAAFVALLLLGLVTGILGVLNPHRKHALAIAGLILNGLVSLAILLLTIGTRLGHL
jgi:hypothetical protein